MFVKVWQSLTKSQITFFCLRRLQRLLQERDLFFVRSKKDNSRGICIQLVCRPEVLFSIRDQDVLETVRVPQIEAGGRQPCRLADSNPTLCFMHNPVGVGKQLNHHDNSIDKGTGCRLTKNANKAEVH
jgi:hypothetical protein